jgi:large subunit ribosomal protein L21
MYSIGSVITHKSPIKWAALAAAPCLWCQIRLYSSHFMAKIAVIQTGGKQYVVADGTVLTIEKLGDVKKDGKITFDKVLLTDDGKDLKMGDPLVKGAKVMAELVSEGKSKKVTVIRYRQKSRYFKKKGHRQSFTKVKITTL